MYDVAGTGCVLRDGLSRFFLAGPANVGRLE